MSSRLAVVERSALGHTFPSAPAELTERLAAAMDRAKTGGTGPLVKKNDLFWGKKQESWCKQTVSEANNSVDISIFLLFRM